MTFERTVKQFEFDELRDGQLFQFYTQTCPAKFLGFK